MELSFLELTKREVISVTDGKSLGFVKDIGLSFPSGIMTGIFVPGKKLKGLSKCFNKTQIFIARNNIVKIGGDVILVDLSKKAKPSPPKKPPCAPVCEPPCPPPCPPPFPSNPCEPPFPQPRVEDVDFRIDTSDY